MSSEDEASELRKRLIASQTEAELYLSRYEAAVVDLSKAAALVEALRLDLLNSKRAQAATREEAEALDTELKEWSSYLMKIRSFLNSKCNMSELPGLVEAALHPKWVSLCVECGPNVGVDEDGLCAYCGVTATGSWLQAQRTK